MQSAETQSLWRCGAGLDAANWLACTLGLCASYECRSHQSCGRGGGVRRTTATDYKSQNESLIKINNKESQEMKSGLNKRQAMVFINVNKARTPFS